MDFWRNRLLRPAKEIQQLVLHLDLPPAPHLAIHHDGISCRLCTKSPYVCCGGQNGLLAMRCHLKLVHNWITGAKGGRLPNAKPEAWVKLLYDTVMNSPISYQTFHRAEFVRYFQVSVPNPPCKRLIDQLLRSHSQARSSTSLPGSFKSKRLLQLQYARLLLSHQGSYRRQSGSDI